MLKVRGINVGIANSLNVLVQEIDFTARSVDKYLSKPEIKYLKIASKRRKEKGRFVFRKLIKAIICIILLIPYIIHTLFRDGIQLLPIIAEKCKLPHGKSHFRFNFCLILAALLGVLHHVFGFSVGPLIVVAVIEFFEAVLYTSRGSDPFYARHIFLKALIATITTVRTGESEPLFNFIFSSAYDNAFKNLTDICAGNHGRIFLDNIGVNGKRQSIKFFVTDYYDKHGGCDYNNRTAIFPEDETPISQKMRQISKEYEQTHQCYARPDAEYGKEVLGIEGATAN